MYVDVRNRGRWMRESEELFASSPNSVAPSKTNGPTLGHKSSYLNEPRRYSVIYARFILRFKRETHTQAQPKFLLLPRVSIGAREAAAAAATAAATAPEEAPGERGNEEKISVCARTSGRPGRRSGRTRTRGRTCAYGKSVAQLRAFLWAGILAHFVPLRPLPPHKTRMCQRTVLHSCGYFLTRAIEWLPKRFRQIRLESHD